MRRFMGKLNRPKREKSEQSNQQKTSSQDRARRAVPDSLSLLHNDFRIQPLNPMAV